MVFSSLHFLFLFLPLALGLYFLTPARYRNGPALAASLFFFAWGAPRFVCVLMATSLLDFLAGRRLAPNTAPDARRRRLLALAVGLNLAILLSFKYANFFVDQFNALRAAAGFAPADWPRVALPIGISFFTFQKISYLVDVFRGTARPAPTYGRYLLFVALFPQLIAGPIVRYHDVDLQLGHRRYTAGLFLDGAWRFAVGLGKKVLIANTLATAADTAFGAGPGGLPCAAAWLGLVAYALQLYYDFAGYSDMAIGLGRMMGFRFLENFDFPYIAAGFAAFWRRWHISLGRFMREYLYIPLGGNRGSRLRTYGNLWLVFLASGFWHGAAWTFVLWGAFHGLCLSLERLLADRGWRPLPGAVSVPLTFLLVCAGWVLFRAESPAQALAYYLALAHRTPAALGLGKMAGLFTHPHFVIAFTVGALGAFAPALGLGRWLPRDTGGKTDALATPALAARAAGTVLLLTASAMTLAMGGFNPFIYFRF